jgi:hypothetical protein
MSIKQRLIKLESKLPPPMDDIHVGYFILDPQNMHPSGYTCDEGTVIMRIVDESTEDLHGRCTEAVYWPIGENSTHIFEPIAHTVIM